MPFEIGTRLGAYEISAQIGAGGMGEVYRARDTRLGRDVAIKVLPAAFATDPDRLARFMREAQILASLNHPHIAHIYGVEHADSVQCLVMELVDGESLERRISRGKLPVDDAVRIAKEIAAALEVAHEKGIVHRDLKPANIALTSAGHVKVLDFGLAKATEPPGSASPAPDLTRSPTLTSPAMLSGVGVILGTAPYMSPEQARGLPVDRRSDIWAFGCVLWEMLTGVRAFRGDDLTETLAAVIKTDPPLDALPRETPDNVRRVLRRCLQKDPSRRLQHIGDVRVELEDAEDDARASVRSVYWPSILALAAALAIIAAMLVVAVFSRSSSRVEPVTRLTVPLPPSIALSTAPNTDVALSPDGRTLVFGNGPSGLLRRRLDSFDTEPVHGAEGGGFPFFSPDGSWIGFRTSRQLLRVPAEGGQPIPICDLVNVGAATWSDDDIIVFAGGIDLYKVPARGGQPVMLLKADRDAGFFQPSFVPHTHIVLVQRGGVRGVGAIEALDLDSMMRHPLIEGSTPRWSTTGDLLFERDGTIWAVPLDLKRFRTEGTPLPTIRSVRRTGARAVYSAANGSLAYLGGVRDVNRSLVWIDRTAKLTPALDVRGAFQSPRLSPDGRRVAISIDSNSGLDLWLYDLDRGARLRLTTSGVNRRAAWSPDGEQIAFYSSQATAGGGDLDIFVVPAAGGEPKRLLARPGPQFPDSWSPDGRFLVFEDGENETSGGRRDLWLMPFGQAPRPLLVTQFNERGAVISPSGQWLAFVTDESGASEVYVQPFPGPGAKIPVSVSGGLQPMWARDGRELYYRDRDWLMVVPIQLQPFSVGTPRRLLELPTRTFNLDPNFSDYDVAPDGRFLAVHSDATGEEQAFVVVNWAEELRRLRSR